MKGSGSPFDLNGGRDCLRKLALPRRRRSELRQPVRPVRGRFMKAQRPLQDDSSKGRGFPLEMLVDGSHGPPLLSRGGRRRERSADGRGESRGIGWRAESREPRAVSRAGKPRAPRCGPWTTDDGRSSASTLRHKRAERLGPRMERGEPRAVSRDARLLAACSGQGAESRELRNGTEWRGGVGG
jgi:hypothetical protein